MQSGIAGQQIDGNKPPAAWSRRTNSLLLQASQSWSSLLNGSVCWRHYTLDKMLNEIFDAVAQNWCTELCGCLPGCKIQRAGTISYQDTVLYIVSCHPNFREGIPSYLIGQSAVSYTWHAWKHSQTRHSSHTTPSPCASATVGNHETAAWLLAASRGLLVTSAAFLRLPYSAALLLASFRDECSC